MRGRALLMAVTILGVTGLAWRAHAAWRPAAQPLACASLVGVVTDSGERVACGADPALARCPEVKAGQRYQDCRSMGPLRGAVLKLHDQPIDVDLASADDLRSLPGVGPGLAARIVEARAAGPFCRPEDLARVSGIGPKRVQQLTGHLQFTDPLCRRVPGQ